MAKSTYYPKYHYLVKGTAQIMFLPMSPNGEYANMVDIRWWLDKDAEFSRTRSIIPVQDARLQWKKMLSQGWKHDTSRPQETRSYSQIKRGC